MTGDTQAFEHQGRRSPSPPRPRPGLLPSPAVDGGQHLVITREYIYRAYDTIRPYPRRKPVASSTCPDQ